MYDTYWSSQNKHNLKKTLIFTGEAASDHLLKVSLLTIPANQCNISYFSSANSKLKFGILHESMVCAGSTDGGKDTCGVRMIIDYKYYAVFTIFMINDMILI